MDLEIDEIAVTITERYPDYTVGEHSMQKGSIINSYATNPIINVTKGGRGKEYTNEKIRSKKSRPPVDRSIT